MRNVRVDLQNTTGSSVPVLDPLARNRELRQVVLTGCAAGLDLAPVAGLPHLERLELSCEDLPPALDSLASVQGEWNLTITAPACGDRLAAASELGSMHWLTLYNCHDLRDLTGLPARPTALRGLSLYGLGSLASLTGIERWNGLATVELHDCWQLQDLGALTAITSLETVELGLTTQSQTDLNPLVGLPRLHRITLRGLAKFDISALAGIENAVIEVPPRSRVTGAEKMGPTSRLTRSELVWERP